MPVAAVWTQTRASPRRRQVQSASVAQQQVGAGCGGAAACFLPRPARLVDVCAVDDVEVAVRGGHDRGRAALLREGFDLAEEVPLLRRWEDLCTTQRPVPPASMFCSRT